MIRIVLSVFIFFQINFGQSVVGQSKTPDTRNKIIIEWVLPENIKKEILNNVATDRLKLNYKALETFGIFSQLKTIEQNVTNCTVKWVLPGDKPIIVNINWVPGTFGVCSSGDSIRICQKDSTTKYSGKGSEKFELYDKLYSTVKRIKKPSSIKYAFAINSLNEYLTWSSYVDKYISIMTPIFDSFENRIPAMEFNFIKSAFYESSEMERVVAFVTLAKNAELIGLKNNNLSAIADSTLSKPSAVWLNRNTDYYGNGLYFDMIDKVEVLRSVDFDQSKATFDDWVSKYYRAKQKYTGTIRERMLQLIVYKNTNRSTLRPAKATAILADYYADSLFPEYKQWVRDWQQEHWMESLTSSQGSMDFTLKDESGKTLSKTDLKNKLALLYFWQSNSTDCKEATPAVQKIYDTYKNDTNIVFVSVSSDTDRLRWMKAIKQGKYTIDGGLHFYSGTEKVNFPVIEYYNGSNFPGLILINGDGVVVEYPLESPALDNGTKIINLIQQHRSELLSKLHDGPYVMHYNDSLAIYYINSPNSYKLVKSKKETASLLTVQTDIFPKQFLVPLKKEVTIEVPVFSGVTKQLVISDIEGNFDAFRKLLTANYVINSNFEWTFGNGHLVLVGDFFDRGKQVTECLWLIYSLEDKAKKEGGYVHFILGNHEIMNLNNDTFYVNSKYKSIAKMLNFDYVELFNKNSELGRWLRTKNIAEKIGDILYVHGGISPSVNRLGLSLRQINDLARPYYDKKPDSSDYKLHTLFDSKKTRDAVSRASPFWFRGYYEDSEHAKEIPTQNQVDSTLLLFQVNKIVTGHTMIGYGDKITTHYNDKIINVDTHHAEGKSKALLIIGNLFYQVDASGEKLLLFNKQESKLVNSGRIKSND